MALWVRKVLWSFGFLLAGAVGQSVNYPDPVCAVKGSTVTLLCSFTPLKLVRVEGTEVSIEIVRVRWCQNHLICHGNTPSVYDSNSNNNDPRYKYLGDKKGNCTLQITDIQEGDDATLRFRMEANNIGGHFTEQSGVNVTVTAAATLRILGSSDDTEVTEGQHVTLLCTAKCTFHQLELTWFRDGHALPESGPALSLGPLTAGDSGNYTCALRDIDGTLSLPYRLHVKAERRDVTTGGVAGVSAALLVPLVLLVLLVLFALVMVGCIIRRKKAVAVAAAAAADQRAAGGDLEQKHHDIIYSNVLHPAEQEVEGPRQEAGRAAEEVSYAAVQFRHKKPDRAAEAAEAAAAEEATIYSALASKG